MNIIDLHCDALLKLYDGKGRLAYRDAGELQANLVRLEAGGVLVQCFAIFIEPNMKAEEKFQAALDQVHYFYTEVLGKNPEMKHIREWSDYAQLKDGEVGAMLTLEGVDAIGNDLHKLSILHQLGVRSVGLTWNNANLAADGAGEPRGGGLTLFGKEVVGFLNANRMLTDVSHLSEKAFWDVAELADYPFASHSNARAICDHPRNLYDEQAKALFNKGGVIHVVFCPPFVKKDGNATIDDLIRHIDHLCSLGGRKQIGFGSDFDGIGTFVNDLEDASKYPNLINELQKRYSEEDVKGFASQNFLNYISRNFD
ncbi:dipeptidase [Planococcus lenghuensis]|uniref:Diguanylate cyclase n=1 Tax=Planococcus lenghuensis TaxID=2213202 RepID=A0A1Q2L420_9BACL|nr:dipeptidase [Planococcus lenghuensis]AQQ54807.1 diguanylate cyclase [Planococcus lenghuensis]